MLIQDTSYHTGARVMIYMVLGKMKWPLILAVIMFAITFGMSAENAALLSWAHGSSAILKSISSGLDAVLKYGWILTALYVVSLGLLAVREYYSLTFRLGDSAFYLRTGLITHRELAISYRQIQTINLVQHPMSEMFGLSSMVVVTSGHEDTSNLEKGDAEGMLSLIHTSLAHELEAELLRRSSGQTVQS